MKFYCAMTKLKNHLQTIALLFFAVPALLTLQACTSIKPENYVPKLGQMGKDVMWLPTSDDLVQKLLEAAKVGPNDILFDLGAGDGKIPIAAAKSFGELITMTHLILLAENTITKIPSQVNS